MRIQHNLSAINSLNKLNRNYRKTATSIEKLSSGLRINKTADDAAGLSISQRMRARIRGLEQAERNIQDGISLVQTAESGLAEIQNPNLQRLRELALQAANGTLTSDDRLRIQEEIDQIKNTINDIANNTHFNGIHLLNVSDTPPSGLTVVNLANAVSITIFEQSGINTIYEETFSIADLVNGVYWSTPAPPPQSSEPYHFSVDLGTNTFKTRAETWGFGNNITAVRVNGLTGYLETEVYATKLVSYSGTPYVGVPPENILGNDLSDSPNFSDGGGVWTEIVVQFEATIDPNSTTLPNQSVDVILQVGPDASDTYKIKLTDARTTALGIDDIAVDPPEKAIEAIGKIDDAINKVSAERSKFGSYQNALEHIHNNASNYRVNLAAAESRITDADMAKEMMELTKSQILSQASQAMLAQAIHTPETVITLLR